MSSSFFETNTAFADTNLAELFSVFFGDILTISYCADIYANIVFWLARATTGQEMFSFL
jgi:hypothetical protein